MDRRRARVDVQDVLRELGMERDFAAIRRLIGMGGDKLLPALTGISADSDQGKQIVERRARHFRDRYLPKAGVPNCGALLARIVRDGLRVGVEPPRRRTSWSRCWRSPGVATTSPPDVVGRRRLSNPIRTLAPAALAKLRLRPDAAVMVGDTPYDVEAAARAAMPAIAFRLWWWGDADLAGAPPSTTARPICSPTTTAGSSPDSHRRVDRIAGNLENGVRPSCRVQAPPSIRALRAALRCRPS